MAKMTAAGRGVAGLVWLQTLTPQPPYHATAVGHIGHRQDREPGSYYVTQRLIVLNQVSIACAPVSPSPNPGLSTSRLSREQPEALELT